MKKTICNAILYTALALLFVVAIGARPMAQTAKPGSPEATQAVPLTPMGQKTLENINLRFQLIQRDLQDLQRSEIQQHGLSEGEYTLDVQRSMLVRSVKSNVPPPSSPIPASDTKDKSKK